MRFAFKIRRNARATVEGSGSRPHKLDGSLLSDSGVVKGDDLSTGMLRTADVAAGVVGGLPVVGGYVGGAMQSLVHQAQDSAGTVDSAIALHERCDSLLCHIRLPDPMEHAQSLMESLNESLSKISTELDVAARTSACRRFRAVRRLQRYMGRVTMVLDTTVDLLKLQYLCDQLSSLKSICSTLSEFTTNSVNMILLEITRLRREVLFYGRIIVFILLLMCFFGLMIVILLCYIALLLSRQKTS